MKEDKILIDKFRDVCNVAIVEVKSTYLKDLGVKLTDAHTSQKSYWKIISKLLNKCKAPKIPPLPINNKFIVNYIDKATTFTNFFATQCKPIVNCSTLPSFVFKTTARLDNIQITKNDIACINLNPGKSNGPDEISVKMILLCGDTIVIQHKIIFENIISTGIYPDILFQRVFTLIYYFNGYLP